MPTGKQFFIKQQESELRALKIELSSAEARLEQYMKSDSPDLDNLIHELELQIPEIKSEIEDIEATIRNPDSAYREALADYEFDRHKDEHLQDYEG